MMIVNILYKSSCTFDFFCGYQAHSNRINASPSMQIEDSKTNRLPAQYLNGKGKDTGFHL